VFDGEEFRSIRGGWMRKLRAVFGDETRSGQSLRLHQRKFRRRNGVDESDGQLGGKVAEIASKSERYLRDVRLG